MDVSISGLEISGGCPHCGMKEKFSLTLIIAKKLETQRYEIGSGVLDCESCGLVKKFPRQAMDCTYALASFVDFNCVNLELLLYKVYAEVTLRERRKTFGERA